MKLSPRQHYVAHLGRRYTRWFIAAGPVGCGKTLPTLRGFGHWAGKSWSGQDLALVTRGHPQMLGVVVQGLDEWLAGMGMTLVRRQRHYEMPDAHGGTLRLWPIVASDTSTVARLQGFTFAGALLDEVAVMPWEIVAEVQKRCRVPGARLIATCNPEGPDHPVKLKVIDRPDVCESHRFALTDNPTLSEEYIRELHEENTGTTLLRKVYGLWAAATGLVLPGLASAVAQPPEGAPSRLDVAADWAQSSVTHAGLFGRWPEGTWQIDEWRHDGRSDGQILPEEQARRMAIHFSRHGTVRSWLVDPTASGLMVALRDVAPHSHIVAAEAAEVEGLQVLNRWLGRRLWIAPSCRETIAEAGTLAWDESPADRSRDVPVRGRDHAADMLRYYAHTVASAEAMSRVSPRVMDRDHELLPAGLLDAMTSEGVAA